MSLLIARKGDSFFSGKRGTSLPIDGEDCDLWYGGALIRLRLTASQRRTWNGRITGERDALLSLERAVNELSVKHKYKRLRRIMLSYRSWCSGRRPWKSAMKSSAFLFCRHSRLCHRSHGRPGGVYDLVNQCGQFGAYGSGQLPGHVAPQMPVAALLLRPPARPC
jgi:hypothetical protein